MTSWFYHKISFLGGGGGVNLIYIYYLLSFRNAEDHDRTLGGGGDN